MTRSVEEHRNSGQDSTNECLSQINMDVSRGQHQPKSSYRQEPATAHGLDNQGNNAFIKLQSEHEGQMRQESPANDVVITETSRRLIL